MPTEITLSNDILGARVSDLGAELQSLAHDGQELLWQGDPAHWSGRAPILFPIVGRAPGDRIAVAGHEAPMKQHGFARRATWTLVDRDATRCTHVLTDTPETRAAYPRPFRLSQTHALDGATLTVTAEVRNTGEAPLPFGLGFHPAFAWPLPGGGDAPHEIVLENGAEPALARLDADGLLAPGRHPSPFRDGRLQVESALFEADAMIFPEGAGEALSYAAPGAPRLAFRFVNCPALGIWSKPGAPFLCIEPWHGMAARQGAGPEIADRPLSLNLSPGGMARFGWSVTIG